MMKFSKDFIIVHTVSQTTTIHGDNIKVQPNERWLLAKYVGKEEQVTIPHGITRIGYGAFAGCETITSVTIPESVKRVDIFVFRECEKLREVVFQGVCRWDDRILQGCSINKIFAPKEFEAAKQYAKKHKISFEEI